MNKKIISLVLLCAAGSLAFAQQDAQFSQNMFNKLDHNPAFAGMNHGICGSMFYRNQWVGFGGAPVTTLININSFVPAMQGGVGLTAKEDRLGNERNFSAMLSGSRHINVGRGELSLGARAGWMQKSFRDNWIATDGVSGDVVIPVNTGPMSYADLGAGAFYLNDREIYVGLSANHVFNTGNAMADAHYKNVAHYYLTAGFSYTPNSFRDLTLRPSVLVKSDAKATIFDLNLLGYWKNRFWVGGSYRMTDAVVVMGGVIMGPLKVGYAYDITTSELKNHSSNTHEIMISYCIKCKPKVKRESHVNPRLMGVGPDGAPIYYIQSNCYLLKGLGTEPNLVQ